MGATIRGNSFPGGACVGAGREPGRDVLKDNSIMPELTMGSQFLHERPDGLGCSNYLKEGIISRAVPIISVADKAPSRIEMTMASACPRPSDTRTDNNDHEVI